MFGDPTVLDLSGAVVLTNDTVNGDGVTCNRLGAHNIVTVRTVCAVSAVDGKDVAIAIGNLHITPGSVVNLNDNAGYIVLTCGVVVVLLGRTKGDCLFDCEGRIGGGLFNFGFCGSCNFGFFGEQAFIADDINLVESGLLCVGELETCSSGKRNGNNLTINGCRSTCGGDTVGESGCIVRTGASED